MQWIQRKIWALMKMAMAKWQEQLIHSLFKYYDTCLWFNTFYHVVLYIKMFYCNHYTGNFLLCMVRYCVAFQITDQNKTFAIILQIFFRVTFSRVDRQMAICNAWKVTMWTSVRLLPRVGHFVFPYFFQAYWRISALTALMRLYPNVRNHVSL